VLGHDCQLRRECGEVGINERRKAGMRLEGTNVSVTPREFTSVENGDMRDARDLLDVEAEYENGVFKYKVREGRCVQLSIQNDGEKQFFVWWDSVEKNVHGQSIKNGSGARLSAEGVEKMTMFHMRGNAIDVAFSNDHHEVLLRLRFENVANVSAASPVGSGGDHVPAEASMQEQEGRMAQTVRMRGSRVPALLARLAALGAGAAAAAGPGTTETELALARAWGHCTVTERKTGKQVYTVGTGITSSAARTKKRYKVILTSVDFEGIPVNAEYDGDVQCIAKDGEITEVELTGQGTMTYRPAQNVYTGRFENGLRHGKGTLTVQSKGRSLTTKWQQDLSNVNSCPFCHLLTY
jgi:hypothetical protein